MHLQSKLGGDVTPHFVICAYTGKHSPAPLGETLAESARRLLHLGLSAGFGGLIYEDQWLATAETSGAAIALWGIYDPGAAEVVLPGGLPSRVRAAVAQGVDRVQRGMPRLTLSCATPS